MLVYILGHEKPTGDLGSARNDTTEEDVYYKEREWRLIPSNIAINSFKEVVKFLQNCESFKDDFPAILIYDELKYF